MGRIALQCPAAALGGTRCRVSPPPARTLPLQTSRVGQAAVSILEYVRRHEQTYLDSGLQGVPERVLRQEFGNNPDTSKALRCLVSEGELQRRGRGGRKDPFSYTVCGRARGLPARVEQW